MRIVVGWLAAGCVVSLAVGLWLAVDPGDQPSGPIGDIDPERASIERLIERTLRESRTGVEAPSTIPAPSGDAPPRAETLPPEEPLQAESLRTAAMLDALPEGYTLGTYHGDMQRAARTAVPVTAHPPNPDWMGAAPAHEAILELAAAASREYSFAVLRVLPATDLQALNRSLAALNSRIEGSTGEYVRVRVPAERGRLEDIEALEGVLGIGAVPPQMKADTAFVREAAALSASEPVPVYITLMAADAAGEWRQALTELGVVVGAYDRDLRSYTANMPAAALGPLLAADFVLSVERVPIVEAHHVSAVPVMGVDGLRSYDAATAQFSGWTGTGVAVGVMDTGLNTGHMDIAHGRSSICGTNFVGGENWDLWLDLHGHGTHVFGTIAGAGRSYPALAGMAPEVSHLRFAKVLSTGGSGIDENIRRGMDYLAQPSGCVWQGEHTEAIKPLIVNMSLAAVDLAFAGRGLGARKLDSIVQSHSQLYVVAQANSGDQGFSNYGAAKNSLSVGAVHDSGLVADFSSHGPTADGRLAPSVVGTGVNLTSAAGSGSQFGNRTFSGTSMASSSVSGVAALLMQARPEFQNRAALARARLMASAIRPDVYLESRAALPEDNTDGPGTFQNQYGLGLVSARTSLLSNDEPGGWFIGSASSRPDNDSYEYIDIKVPEDATRLDIVLTWDEPPADILTRSVLNNLDLWADRGADCGEGACGEYSSRSEVDNVEWLLIQDPAAGTYRIKVVPVEVYGEPSTAAVAWKVLRGNPTPELKLEVEDTSPSDDSEYLTLDVTVDANHHVASGTTVHLGCRGDCAGFIYGYRAYRTRVLRKDDVTIPEDAPLRRDHLESTSGTAPPVSIGEVLAGQPRRLQLQLERETLSRVAQSTTRDYVSIIARSWNAEAASRCLEFGTDSEIAVQEDCDAPVNDDFSAATLLVGGEGEASADFFLASQEPGDPGVTIDSRTLWYRWRTPTDGLYRFRLQESDTGDAASADLALFTGNSLAGLEMAVEKHDASELSFPAQESAEYRLRIASNSWRIPPPITLQWESADSRPGNDDFAFARMIEGVQGQVEGTNDGATIERGEFLGGAAASVWYRWTAPDDGVWTLFTDVGPLTVRVFEGASVSTLRLLSSPVQTSRAHLVAKKGETYHVLVGTRSADASSHDFTLSWDPITSASFGNSLFEGAMDIGGREGIAAVSEGELVEPGEPQATGAGTRWWRWTAPADGRFTWRMDQSFSVSISDRTSTAFRLTLFTGESLENLEVLGTLKSGGGTFVLDATEGVRYWIAVGRSAELIGSLTPIRGRPPTEFTWGPTPANDDRDAAFAIAGATGSALAMLGYATRAPNEPSEPVGENSVWWRWSTPDGGWHRFWVEGNQLSNVLAIYPSGVAMRPVADSERTLHANGRAELFLLAEPGRIYEIRLATRPGLFDSVTGPREAQSGTLRWKAATAPAYLGYKGAVTRESLASTPLPHGLLQWPNGLAISEDGDYLFSSSNSGILVFLRDSESGELVLAHAPERSGEPHRNYATLIWDAQFNRLIGMSPSDSSNLGFEAYSLDLFKNGALGPPDKITLSGGSGSFSTGGKLSPDGRHFYVQSYQDRNALFLEAFSVDAPTKWVLVQTVQSQGVPNEDVLVVDGIHRAVDMTFSSDGGYLYVATENALLAFERDKSSGKLQFIQQIQGLLDPESPLSVLRNIRYVSLGGDGTTLFVSGKPGPSTGCSTGYNELAIVAFDIEENLSNPVHLTTFSGLAWQKDKTLCFYLASHLDAGLDPFSDCERPVPHAGRAAVDVVCRDGYFVVEWRPDEGEYEAVDWSKLGEMDRFRAMLPQNVHTGPWILRWPRVVQSPDGAHVYIASNTTAIRWGHEDAIHIIERAAAMTQEDARNLALQ